MEYEVHDAFCVVDGLPFSMIVNSEGTDGVHVVKVN
jgi:hypothetical protein